MAMELWTSSLLDLTDLFFPGPEVAGDDSEASGAHQGAAMGGSMVVPQKSRRMLGIEWKILSKWMR